jgi:NAD(P)-dependent dehydrogenase (short-subunit alcohol dehydrogenase family)
VPVGDMFRLDGSVAIVTGASSGLGVQFAYALAESGAVVAVIGRRVDRLERTAAEIERRGGRALVVPGDVTDPRQCASLVTRTFERFGKADILVNNAGVGSGGPALKESEADFRNVIETNVNGCFWMAQAFARRADPGSVIVNIGSILGHTTAGLPHAAYSASKAAIAGLTRDLAAQWSPRRGIRVNCLAPGFFPSEMTERYPDGYLERMAENRTLLLRLGDPKELAATVVWLVSPASGYVTGQTIVVDGGVSIT